MSEPVLILKPVGDEGTHEAVVVDRTPFRMGRRQDCDLVLAQPDVSAAHAELRHDGEEWWLADAGSRNGTFLNGARVTRPVTVKEGDLIALGNAAYEILSSDPGRVSQDSLRITRVEPMSRERARSTVVLLDAVERGACYPVFQPVCHLMDGAAIGWEGLGRAGGENTATEPLFALAAEKRLAARLSAALRSATFECAGCHRCWPESRRAFLFLNAHRDEFAAASSRFVEDLGEAANGELRQHFKVVVEIPESFACQASEMKGFVEAIRDRGMFVAYDDFGKGQSRLAEFLEVPPDFLKLDRAIVAGLDSNRVKREFVQGVVEACRGLGVRLVAEGIETPGEKGTCTELEIEFGQGEGVAPPLRAYELFGVDPASLVDSCVFVRRKFLP